MKNSVLTTLLMSALFATAPALNSKAQDSATLIPGDGVTIHALGGFKTWTKKDVNGETQTFTQTQENLDKIIATPTNDTNVFLFPEDGGGWNTDANKATGIQGIYIDMGSINTVGTVHTTWEGAAANAMDIYVMQDEPSPQNIQAAKPAFSGTGLGQYTEHTANLTSYNRGRYLALVPREATNWDWGVKIRSLAAISGTESVLTTFNASPAFVQTGEATQMTFTFGNQLGSDFDSEDIIVTCSDNATLNGKMLTINSGESAMLTATLNGVSLSTSVYAITAPTAPKAADIKAPVLVDAESAKTATWALGWDGGATDKGNVTFNNGTVAKYLGDVKTVFFGNSLYTGNTADTDFNPSEKGYKSLRLSILSLRAINGSLTIQGVRYGEDQNGQEKSVSFQLEAGKWSQLTFDCSNVTNIHAMSVKLSGDNVGDLLLANIYFTPVSIEGDTTAPVIESATANCTLPMSANIVVNATDDMNPTVTYEVKYGDQTVNFEGASGEEATHTIEGLLPNTEYTFAVTASDGANVSKPTNVVVTTLAEDAEFSLGNNPDGSVRYLAFSTFQTNDNQGSDRISDGDFTTGFIAVNRPNGVTGVSSDDDKTAYAKSRYPWVGVDMGMPQVINKIRFAPLKDNNMELGMFQGANKRDFSDAVALHMIMGQPAEGQWTDAEIDCTKGFRYVRYVGPDDMRSHISEIRVFGTQGEGTDDKYVQLSELPTLYVNTKDSEDPWDNAFDPDKEHKIKTQIITINNNGIFVSEPGTIKERGNGSRNFPKKPYQLKFDKKQKIMPNATAKLKKWVLLNNATDQTQLRNELAFRVSEKFGMEFTPFHQQVELVLNGQYKGIYLLADQVEVNPGRIPVEELSYTDDDDEIITGGYHMEVDAYACQEPDGAWFSTVDQDEENVRNGNNKTSGITVTLKSPEAPEEEDVIEDGTLTMDQAMANFNKQRSYIKNHFKAMIDAIPDGTAAAAEDGDAVDPVEKYRSMLDVSSLMKHILINEVCGNKDAMWSVHMYKKRGDDHIYAGPIWDFDIAFQNSAMENKHINDKTWMFLTDGSAGVGPWVGSVEKMMKNDPYWKEDISYEWNKARYYGLSAEWMNQQVDDAAEQISTALPAHLKRWPIEATREDVYIGDKYQDHIDFLKNFITQSVDHVDDPAIANYDANWDPVITGIDNIGNDRANRKVTVYSIDGRRIWSGAQGEMPRLGAGVYILRGDKSTRKVIVK